MRAFQITQFGLENLQLVDLPTPSVRRWNGADSRARDLSELSRSVDGSRPLRSQTEDAAHSALRWSRRSCRCGSRSDPLQSQAIVSLDFFCRTGRMAVRRKQNRAEALGGDIDGMLADYVVLPEHGVAHFPAHLSYEEAATLPCAALTAWNALFHVSHDPTRQHDCDSGNGRSFYLRVAVCQVSGSACARHIQ